MCIFVRGFAAFLECCGHNNRFEFHKHQPFAFLSAGHFGASPGEGVEKMARKVAQAYAQGLAWVAAYYMHGTFPVVTCRGECAHEDVVVSVPGVAFILWITGLCMRAWNAGAPQP